MQADVIVTDDKTRIENEPIKLRCIQIYHTITQGVTITPLPYRVLHLVFPIFKIIRPNKTLSADKGIQGVVIRPVTFRIDWSYFMNFRVIGLIAVIPAQKFFQWSYSHTCFRSYNHHPLYQLRSLGER